MGSVDWSNLKHHVLGQIQEPDSFSRVSPSCYSNSELLTSWDSDIDSVIAIPQRRNVASLQHIRPGISTCTGSVLSLDCFVSAPIGLTDTTPAEDDGISSFFSDHPWNSTAVKPVLPVSLSGNLDRGLDTGTAISLTPADKHAIINRYRISDNHNQPDCAKTKIQNLDLHQSNDTATACHPGRTSFPDTSQIHPIPKKPRLVKHPLASPNYDFNHPSSPLPPNPETTAQLKEMIYREAAFRPVSFTMETVEKPKRKNTRVSKDPQTVAARHRRERISERIRALQKLVPGGSKMDTASMLDEAANYLKFLRAQIRALEAIGHNIDDQIVTDFPGNVNLAFSPTGNYLFFNPK